MPGRDRIDDNVYFKIPDMGYVRTGVLSRTFIPVSFEKDCKSREGGWQHFHPIGPKPINLITVKDVPAAVFETIPKFCGRSKETMRICD